MNSRYSIILLLICSLSNTLFAQQSKPVAISYSHIYFTIDTACYRALSNNKFCTDTLFYYSKGAVKTDQGNWDGQYMEGEYDYLEIFQPDNISNMKVGDIGIGFMLHQPYSSAQFQQEWQKLSNDKIVQEVFTTNSGKDTIMVEIMNYRDSMLTGGPTSFFVLYYNPGLLKQMNFKEDSLHTGITQKDINQRMHAYELYNRPFKKVEKIYIQLTAHEYERHKIALQAMGYTEISKQLFKKDIEIDIRLNDRPVHRLKKIEFSLTKKLETRKHIISPNLYISIFGEKGELVLE